MRTGGRAAKKGRSEGGKAWEGTGRPFGENKKSERCCSLSNYIYIVCAGQGRPQIFVTGRTRRTTFVVS